MIVRFLSNGKSFKGCSAYLMHDPNAQTQERVAWTHTLNLANDHVPSAVDEMVWTARNADLLKQEAGIRAGGRATESPVKHWSLNWAAADNPTREHMIATTEDFLRHMGWSEHQTVIVAHDDKAYRHVHGMVNMVHPVTGLRLNDDFERRRAQAWALEYEREQGRIHCEQRLLDPEQREKAAPRNIWAAFQENQKEFARAEKALQENEENSADAEKNRKNADWKILKQFQRDERTDFFAQGKIEFSELRSSIYRDVREEFRDRWANYYAAQKDGPDSEALATMKQELVAEQKAVLEARRDAACKELRETRDERYHELLGHQRLIRADLRDRQNAELDNALFLQHAQGAGKDLVVGFRGAAHQVATPQPGNEAESERGGLTAGSHRESTSSSRVHRGDGVGLRVGISVGSFLDALFCDLINLGSSPTSHEPPTDPAGRDLFAASAEETAKHQQQQREREEADEESRRKQRPL